MSVVNVKNLLSVFGRDLDRAGATRLADEIRSARGTKEVDAALELASTMLGGFGVEAIRGGDETEYAYFGIVLLYVNMGDTYADTIVFEPASRKFAIMSYGDWVERAERKGITVY